MIAKDGIVAWCQTHLYTTLFVAWMLSNATSVLPTPAPDASKGYIWFFGFAHATFGAVPRLIAALGPSWLKSLIPTTQTPTEKLTNAADKMAVQIQADQAKAADPVKVVAVVAGTDQPQAPGGTV